MIPIEWQKQTAPSPTSLGKLHHKMMDIQKIIKYWKESAEKDFEAAEGILKLKHYAACLFFCHLTLEKLLKGLVVEDTKTHAPHIHELDKLAEKANLDFNEEQMEQLKIITTFNIRARYDDLKHSFYKKCTKEYTEEYFNISKNLYLWLKKQYPKK